jgi:hypothetical protein
MGSLKHVLKEKEKQLIDELAARRLAEDRLVIADLLVTFLRGDTTSDGVHGIKSPRKGSPR